MTVVLSYNFTIIAYKGLFQEFVVKISLSEFNAQLLLDARKKSGITQKELAEKVGLDKGYISRVERGLIVPSITTFSRIAAALGFAITLKPLY